MPEVDEMELIYSLVGFPNETEWIEFKEGNGDPERIGRDISALANAAAYHGREFAYKIWGVTDAEHDLVGTQFDPATKKAKGNQDLLIWLPTFLSNNANYSFRTIVRRDVRFVVLTVHAAVGQPVYFDKAAYIREGSSTTRLVGGSAKEAELWKRLQGGDYESRVAEKDVAVGEVSDLLDTHAYFSLLGVRQPGSNASVADALCEQGLMLRQDNGRLSVTNLGALLVGRRLTSFAGLGKRPLRVVRFAGKGSFDIVGSETFDEGYALALPEAERHVMAQIPANEEVDGAFRRIAHAYPQRAVRELLTNCLIHQDLSDATLGPMVMIYENRIEFTNPGTSLVPIPRLLNAQPRSRNARLASLMRQMGLCEEGGTGWDLAVSACESVHMAPPLMSSEDGLGTRVSLFRGDAYDRMSKAERRDAVYWHACLMYAQGEAMGNQSLRERFGLSDERKNMIAISRLVRECRDMGLIREEDAEAGDRYRRYLPYWA